MSAARMIERWRAVWFPPAPLSDLAIARVLLVAVVLHLNGSLRFFWVPRTAETNWQPIGLIAALGIGQPSIEQMQIIHWSSQALLFAGAVGFLTNFALLGAFVLQLVQEAFLNCFGKVSHSTIPLLHAMLFFALAPSGRAYSVDALLRRLWRGSESVPSWSRFARWPFELTFVELAFYYFCAGLSKVARGGFAWADGPTLQFYLLEQGTPVGVWVASYPLLCTALSWCALAFELGFPLAIFIRRLRIPYLLIGVTFHIANHFLLNLLYWAVPAVYLVAISASELRATLGRVWRTSSRLLQPTSATARR